MHLLKTRNSSIQRLVKRLFLHTNHVLDMALLGADFGKYLAHRGSQHVHEFVKKRLVKSESPAVTHCPAQNATEDIISIRVAWLDPVRDREAQGANVVGNNAECDVD